MLQSWATVGPSDFSPDGLHASRPSNLEGDLGSKTHSFQHVFLKQAPHKGSVIMGYGNTLVASLTQVQSPALQGNSK